MFRASSYDAKCLNGIGCPADCTTNDTYLVAQLDLIFQFLCFTKTRIKIGTCFSKAHRVSRPNNSC